MFLPSLLFSYEINKNANADYDEIKIFNKALSESEVIHEYLG